MTLEDLLNKTCLIGLSYFDTQKELLKQIQYAGKVVNIDKENGISIKLIATSDDEVDDKIASDKQEKIFVLPPLLSSWFKAPEGTYKNAAGTPLIIDPDFFVTWDIYQTQDEKKGDHEWWEWVPRTTPPKVN